MVESPSAPLPAAEESATLTREKTPAERLVGLVREAIEADLLADVQPKLEELHPADLADIIEYLDKEDRRALVVSKPRCLCPKSSPN